METGLSSAFLKGEAFTTTVSGSTSVFSWGISINTLLALVTRIDSEISGLNPTGYACNSTYPGSMPVKMTLPS